MWDKVLSFAGEKLLPLLQALRGLPKDVEDIKEVLKRIQVFINDADKMAAAEQDNTRDGIKTKVKKLIEEAFRIEDVAEDYMITEEQQPARDPGCASIPCATVDFIKTMILRLRISYEIQDIKSRVREIHPILCEPSSEQGSSSSTISQNVTFHSLRKNALIDEEADVVGFEAPREELIGWLEEGRAERTVISVVGMGGQGKTTLAKTVFDKVIGEFDCYAWITVSQVYSVEGLLRDMLIKFCKSRKEAPPNDISKMHGPNLINEVINYLKQKRYVVFFDDVWKNDFWNEIESAVLDNKKRSRILITTRKMEVANFCKTSVAHIQKLQPLALQKSWELFCKKAFRNEPDGCCPEELKDISSKIVNKCDGLPLAIIAIGGLLATKENKSFEWQNLCETLILELEKNPNSTGITNILGLSYDDLPYHLKSCFLYFGIYPEDYEVRSDTLIKQWIAEGFVKKEQKKTLEKVAEEYLKELIYRSLVQISSVDIDGNIKCRVHDLLHEIILTKIGDLNFCHFVEDDNSVFSGMIRRLKITTNSNNLMVNIEGSHIQSLYIFRGEEEEEVVLEDFVRKIPTKYKLLKVLDFENSPLCHVPENLGNLLRLRYLSFRGTNIMSLPSSIGLLQFLETLDLRQTSVRQMPREINKLTKLRHLLGDEMEMMDGVGRLVSLQTLSKVDTSYGGEELIKELAKLRELRLLSLINVKREYGSTLCSSLKEMQHLEKLYVISTITFEVIDLHDISPFPLLQKLRLRGKLERLPKWIPELKNLVTLELVFSKLIDDPLESLKDMPNLLCLILYYVYEGESLHFQDGGFKKLKKLALQWLRRLNSILIGERALPLLEEFELWNVPKLKRVPSGIHHLDNLSFLNIINMAEEFNKSIREDHWINTHVRQVNILE